MKRYDAAHRLWRITDSLGNRIEYTLDGLGNRKHESLFDPAGVLTRTRVYNSLNRRIQEREYSRPHGRRRRDVC